MLTGFELIYMHGFSEYRPAGNLRPLLRIREVTGGVEHFINFNSV
jgi:hypothetical protein